MSSKLFRIEIIQPKFDEIYSKFQNTCDIDSWANTVQEKGIKNLRAGKDIDENLPDLFQLSDEDLLNTTDKKKPLEPDKNKLESYAVRESIELWVNPIAKKVESGKIPYEKDGLFYSLWKYANASRLTGKSLIAFTDLAPLEGNQRFTTFEFLNSLRGLNIELENITFHEDIYKKFCKTEHEYITEYAAKYPETDSGKTIKKLFKNQAKFSDILGLLGRFDELFKIKVQLDGLLEFIEFSPTPSEKNIKPLKKWLGIYLQCLIEDKLFSEDLKNFYRFIRQKEIFLDHIKTEVRDYGLEFVFRQGGVISVQREGSVSIGEDKSYLFIHTLAALERQGFFEIERIFITDMDVPPEKQTDDYKVKIVASEKLLDEYKEKTFSTPTYSRPSFKTNTGLSEKSATLKSIEKLGVVRPNNESRRFLVVVNENYQSPVKGDQVKPSWEMLFKVADGEKLTGSEYKSSLEYFNTNKNCKLYTQTGCLLTKIFKTEHYITSMIPIEMISEKAFKQRQGKSRNTT